jgi:hypothetical protein
VSYLELALKVPTACETEATGESELEHNSTGPVSGLISQPPSQPASLSAGRPSSSPSRSSSRPPSPPSPSPNSGQATRASSCYEAEPGRLIQRFWEGGATVSMDPGKPPRKAEMVCWHCHGSGHCSCVTCWRPFVGEAAECVVCHGRGKVLGWAQ